MDRQALKILLRSGRFLCFDTRPAYYTLGRAPVPRDTESIAASTGDDDGAATSAPPAEEAEAPSPPKQVPEGALFDNRTLNLGIYFKESGSDGTAMSVTTRVFFPYNDQNLLEGGESTLAAPHAMLSVLEEKGAIAQGEGISDHDIAVLETLASLPTFDPFLLLSRRREMEVHRTIDDLYFQIGKGDWDRIRQPVMRRISVLVAKAHGADSADVYEFYRQGVGDVSKTMAAEQRGMVTSVVDSIWRGEATEQAKMLISSFQLDAADTERILFAWKGVNYYEYQFRQYEAKCRPLFEWLASGNAQPKDAAKLDSGVIARIKARRETATRVLRETYRNIATILKSYNSAFDALVSEDRPGEFRDFLAAAPESFVSLGMSLGVLAHATNAWIELTHDGEVERIRAADLEPFFDFVGAIGQSELAEAGG